MAEVLSEFPVRKGTRESGLAFLLDGKPYRLTRGVDFPERQEFASLRVLLGQIATRHNMRQRTRVESADVIVVQLCKLETE